jgi:hypothetical protein
MEGSMKLLSKQQLFALTAVVVLLGSGLAYMYVTADPPGYCRAQQRYIPDEEFIKTSAALLYWDMNRTYPDGTKRRDVMGYENLDFDPTNPNCCSVGREISPSIFDRFFGFQEVEVRLNPKTSTRPVKVMGDGYIENKYSICGELLYSSTGHPTSGHTKVTTTNYLEITNKK